MTFIHLDDARRLALGALEEILGQQPEGARAVLVDDLFGSLRVALWAGIGADIEVFRQSVDEKLRTVAGSAWSGTFWLAQPNLGRADSAVLEAAWNEGVEVAARLKILDRVRNRVAWFEAPRDPPWPGPNQGPVETVAERPAIVAFCSFKGGVGRTTALAGFALSRASQGERVVVLDFDLDAPGAGKLLDVDEDAPRWGVVDYLLERPRGEVPLTDYLSIARADPNGLVEVIPAGLVNDDYLTKLARIDLEFREGAFNPLIALLEDVRRERKPNWILIDTRSGLSAAAGVVLEGIAHSYVVFATANSQSRVGLARFAQRVGADRLQSEPPRVQAPLVVVQAMVPEDPIGAEEAKGTFKAMLEDVLTEHYLLEAGSDPNDEFWSVQDLDTADGPHNPIPIPYNSALAAFTSLDMVADVMKEGKPYQLLNERIVELSSARTLASEGDVDESL